MVQMDIPAAFAFAQLFAWCGRQRLQQEEASISGRFTVIAGSYALGVIGPCALYLYGGWPEWEKMYWFEPIRMETGNFGNPLFALVAPLFLVGLAVSAATGFLLAHHWTRVGRVSRVMLTFWIGIAVIIGVVLLTPSAPMFVGHLPDYRAYIRDAVASGRAWEYGVIGLGPWALGIPVLAHREILAKYRLITCFDPGFFIPLVVDSLFYFGFTAALAIRFHRQRTVRVVGSRGVALAGRAVVREEGG